MIEINATKSEVLKVSEQHTYAREAIFMLPNTENSSKNREKHKKRC